MKQVGRLYLTHGTPRTVKPRNGKQFSTREMEWLLGGPFKKIPNTGEPGCRSAFHAAETVTLPENDVASKVFKTDLRGNVVQILEVKADGLTPAAPKADGVTPATPKSVSANGQQLVKTPWWRKKAG